MSKPILTTGRIVRYVPKGATKRTPALPAIVVSASGTSADLVVFGLDRFIRSSGEASIELVNVPYDANRSRPHSWHWPPR